MLYYCYVNLLSQKASEQSFDCGICWKWRCGVLRTPLVARLQSEWGMPLFDFTSSLGPTSWVRTISQVSGNLSAINAVTASQVLTARASWPFTGTTAGWPPRRRSCPLPALTCRRQSRWGRTRYRRRSRSAARSTASSWSTSCAMRRSFLERGRSLCRALPTT